MSSGSNLVLQTIFTLSTQPNLGMIIIYCPIFAGICVPRAKLPMDIISEQGNNASSAGNSAVASGASVSGGGNEEGGKKRKHTNVGPSNSSSSTFDTTLFKAYSSTSSDGKVSLSILKQPEKQHRARYHTEGSRGAVKDRGQNGFPSVQLRGNYKKAATLQVFVGSDTGTPIPHLYYQACKVSGKNSTPCREMKKENTDVILIDIDPEKEGVVVCDCVGILKERHSDIEGKVPPNKRVNWKKKTTKCRIVFRTEVEINGKVEILQAVTDTISCTQLPGTPEILKMSMTSTSVEGGEELWIIGKNFLKDTEVVIKEDGTSWCERVKPIKEFFSNNHLIVVVPPYRDPNSTESVVVTLLVKCGSKASEPRCLTLKPAQPIVKLNGVLNPAANHNGTTTGLLVNLNGNSASLVAAGIAMQSNCKKETIYSARPTILEHIEEDQNKVPTRVSRVSRKKRERKTPFSRTRELPELQTDEAMFEAVVETAAAASNGSLDRSGVNWSALLNRHSRQASADRVSSGPAVANPTSPPTQVQQNDSSAKVQNNTYRQHILIPDETTTVAFKTEELSNQYMEETTVIDVNASDNTVFKVQTTTNQEAVTSPTSHFENLSFQTGQTGNGPSISKTEFTNVSVTATATQDPLNQATNPVNQSGTTSAPNPNQPSEQFFHSEPNQQPNPSTTVTNPNVSQKSVVNPSDSANTSTANETNGSACSLGIDNSGTESATISIKLPPSVLQNQKQLSTIVNTISKALNPQQQTASEPTDQSVLEQPSVKTSPTATFSPDQQTNNEVINQTTSPQSSGYNSAQTSWQQPSTQQQQSETSWNTDQSKIQENWLGESDGFENKRKRVSDTADTLAFSTSEQQPLDTWSTQPTQNQPKPIESWNSSKESWTTNPASQQAKVLENWPPTQPTQPNNESTVESWTTQQVQESQAETQWNDQTWSAVTTTVQDTHLTTTWSTEESNKLGSATVNSTSSWNFVTPSATVNNTNSAEKSNDSWNFVTPSATGVNNTNNADNSNDSEKCPKWENINAKPLDQSWPNSNTNDTFNSWNTTSNTSTNTWTVVTTAASSLNDATTTWTTVSKWGNQDLQQPMDSVGSGSTPSQAEMLPVNPKEVSPMDIDVANTNGLQMNTVYSGTVGQPISSTQQTLSTKPMANGSGNPDQHNLINSFTS